MNVISQWTSFHSSTTSSTMTPHAEVARYSAIDLLFVWMLLYLFHLCSNKRLTYVIVNSILHFSSAFTWYVGVSFVYCGKLWETLYVHKMSETLVFETLLQQWQRSKVESQTGSRNPNDCQSHFVIISKIRMSFKFKSVRSQIFLQVMRKPCGMFQRVCI